MQKRFWISVVAAVFAVSIPAVAWADCLINVQGNVEVSYAQAPCHKTGQLSVRCAPGGGVFVMRDRERKLACMMSVARRWIKPKFDTWDIEQWGGKGRYSPPPGYKEARCSGHLGSKDHATGNVTATAGMNGPA